MLGAACRADPDTVRALSHRGTSSNPKGATAWAPGTLSAGL
jgi:hypothetical protein